MSEVERREHHLGWLDVLKGSALLWIVWNHFAEELFGYPLIGNPGPGWPPLAERWRQLLPDTAGVGAALTAAARALGWSGDLGVTLFLVASGVGLAYGRTRAPAFGPWGAFLRRRLLRLYPLWLAAHAVVLGPGVLLGSQPLRDVLLSALGIRFTPGTYFLGVPAWWYFGLQFQLYLLFPVLWTLLARRGPALLLGATLALGLAARAAGVLWMGAYLDPWLRGAVCITQLPVFAMGLVLGRALGRDAAGTLRRLGSVPSLATAAVALVATAAAALTWPGMVVLPVVAAMGLVPLGVGLARATGGSAPGRALGWIGRHSYSLYLMHQAVILRISPRGAPLWRFAVAAVLILPVSILLERVTVAAERALTSAAQQHGGRSLVMRAGLVVLFFLAAVEGAEFAVRRLAPQEVLGWGERPSLEPYPRWGWRLRPDTVTRLRWHSYDYTVRSNALGLPGPDPRAERSPGALRIVTAGDAFTSAEGVDTERAWPRVLGRILTNRLRRPVEVIDVAVTGWGPAQYGPALEDLLPALRPDAVIIGFFINDPEDAAADPEIVLRAIGFQNPDPSTEPLRPLHLRAWLRNTVIDPLRARLTGKPTEDSLFLSGVAWLGADGARFTTDGLGRTATWLTRIRNAAAAVGAPVVLSIIPSPAQVCAPSALPEFPPGVDLSDRTGYDVDLPQRRITEIAARVGLPSDDLRAALRLAPVCPYQPHNLHLTAAGHEIVAAHIADRWAALWSADRAAALGAHPTAP